MNSEDGVLRLRKGEVVYTILRHTSRGGMTRWIDAFAIRNGEVVSILAFLTESQIERLRYDAKKGGFKCVGYGMDMGCNFVNSISNILLGEAYLLKHRWA